MIWPVAERGRSWSRGGRSASVGTTRSIPMKAMCTGGAAVTRRPLPSLVTRTIEPVSATARLAPEMPTSSLEEDRPQRAACGGVEHGHVIRVRDAEPLVEQLSNVLPVRWTMGEMMCAGGSPRSWTMYSPRSVSTTRRPARSRAGLRPISSVTIDLDLATSVAP